jgi:hypothetical protein
MSDYLTETKAEIAGRMREITDALQIDPRAYRQHIICPRPQHNDRNPSFRLDERRDRGFCTCGTFDGIDLARDIRGLPDLGAGADWVRLQLGLSARNGHAETSAEQVARLARIAEARRQADERKAKFDIEGAQGRERLLSTAVQFPASAAE